MSNDPVTARLQMAAAANGNGYALDVRGKNTVAIQVAGTFSATVNFEGSVDGGTYFPLQAMPRGGGALVTTATATGLWLLDCSSLFKVRARVSDWADGTVTVDALASDSGAVDLEDTVETWSGVMLGAATAYRSGLTAADVIAVPGTVTCTKQAGGACTAGEYTVRVIAGNTYGRTTPVTGNVTVTTETTNLTVRAAFAAVAGATYYDIYCSTDGVAAKFVGRITETQRGTGIILTAVNTTGAGGTAGAVDIEVPGTGLAANLVAVNTAYDPETVAGTYLVTPSGAANVDVNVTMTRTGDSVAPSVVLLPFYAGASGKYYQGDPITVTFGGAAATYGSLRQSVRFPSRGRSTAVLVAAIAGTGASVALESVIN